MSRRSVNNALEKGWKWSDERKQTGQNDQRRWDRVLETVSSEPVAENKQMPKIRVHFDNMTP